MTTESYQKLEIPFLLALFLFFGCTKPKKNLEEYYPQVEITAAELLPNAEVIVEGRIVSEGEAEIEAIGFCASADDMMPDITSNQSLSNQINSYGYFNAKMSLGRDSGFYINAWAANKFGFSYGTPIYIDSVYAAPVVAPCVLSDNYVKMASFSDASTYFSVSQPNQQVNGWEVTAISGSGPAVTLTFGESPITKEYSTVIGESIASDQVKVSFYQGSISGVCMNGASVYVNKTSTDIWTIEVCDANWDFNGSIFSFNTRAISPT